MSYNNIPYTIDLPAPEECTSPASPLPCDIVHARLAHTVFWKATPLFIHDLSIGSLGPTLRPADWQSELLMLIRNRANQSWDDEKCALVAIVRLGVLHQGGDDDEMDCFDEKWEWERRVEEAEARQADAEEQPDDDLTNPFKIPPLADRLIRLVQDAVDALGLLYPSFVQPSEKEFHMYTLRCMEDDLRLVGFRHLDVAEQKFVSPAVVELAAVAAAEHEEEGREAEEGEEEGEELPAANAVVVPTQQHEEEHTPAALVPVPQQDQAHDHDHEAAATSAALVPPQEPEQEELHAQDEPAPSATSTSSTSTKRAREEDDAVEPAPKRPCRLAEPLPRIPSPPPNHPPRYFYPGMPVHYDHADEPAPPIAIASPEFYHVDPRVLPVPVAPFFNGPVDFGFLHGPNAGMEMDYVLHLRSSCDRAQEIAFIEQVISAGAAELTFVTAAEEIERFLGSFDGQGGSNLLIFDT